MSLGRLMAAVALLYMRLRTNPCADRKVIAGRCLHGSSRTTWGGWSRATAAWPTESLYRTAGEHYSLLQMRIITRCRCVRQAARQCM